MDILELVYWLKGCLPELVSVTGIVFYSFVAFVVITGYQAILYPRI